MKHLRIITPPIGFVCRFVALLAAIVLSFACAVVLGVPAHAAAAGVNVSIDGIKTRAGKQAHVTDGNGNEIKGTEYEPSANRTQQFRIELGGTVSNIQNKPTVSFPIQLSDSSIMGFGGMSCPATVEGVFNVSCTRTDRAIVVTMKATDQAAKYYGDYKFGMIVEFTAKRSIIRSTSLKNTITVNAGKPWTLWNAPIVNKPATNPNGLNVTGLASSSSTISFWGSLGNIDATNTALQGGNALNDRTGKNNVFWFNITLKSGGQIANVSHPLLRSHVQYAYDSTHVGTDGFTDVDLKNPLKEKTLTSDQLKDLNSVRNLLGVGEYAYVKNGDGSFSYAINLGPLVGASSIRNAAGFPQDEMTDKQIKTATGKLVSALGLYSPVTITVPHPEISQTASIRYAYDGYAASDGTFTVNTVPVQAGGNGTNGSYLDYQANAKDATGDTTDVTNVIGYQTRIAQSGFKRSGYTFVGWNSRPDGKGKSYPVGSDFSLPVGGATLYAQWEVSVKPPVALPQTGGMFVPLSVGGVAVIAVPAGVGISMALRRMRRRNRD